MLLQLGGYDGGCSDEDSLLQPAPLGRQAKTKDAFNSLFPQIPTVQMKHPPSTRCGALTSSPSPAPAPAASPAASPRREPPSCTEWGRRAWCRDDSMIPPEDLEIARKPDGSPWRLGSGSYGTVWSPLHSPPPSPFLLCLASKVVPAGVCL